MNDKPQVEDLEILHPERILVIAGESITVRELGFAQTLRLEAAMAPLIRAFIDLRDPDGDGYADIAALFSLHAEAWVGFMSAACGKPRAWIETLDDDDGRRLSMEVWTVNASFFTRRVISGMIARDQIMRVRSASASSTQH